MLPIATKELEDPIYTCGVINSVANRLKVDPNPFLVDGFYADKCMRNFSAVATMCSQGGIYLNENGYLSRVKGGEILYAFTDLLWADTGAEIPVSENNEEVVSRVIEKVRNPDIFTPAIRLPED